MLKRCLVFLLAILFININCYAEEKKEDLELSSKSAVLMDVNTGTVIYNMNGNERVSPASITKIMTLLITFEELEKQNIMLDDMVVTSEYAMSMGGSQVFLEEGEKQTVEDMIKCIVISSGNDASVAIAEHISGSESAFVKRMNEKAAELGMYDTHFEDCCGLSESDNHYTTAKDVALMSRELLFRYPEITKYSTIWMDTITHVTKKGNSEFGLSSTNKLLKMICDFEVTGLKTGSTSKAKYCLSASGKKDNIELVAVVMAAPDYKTRFSEARTMLEYGFSICKMYTDKDEKRYEIDVKGGTKKIVSGNVKTEFSHLFLNNEDVSKVKKKVVYVEKLNAPVEKGEIIGRVTYLYEDKNIGNVDIVAMETVKKAKYTFYLKMVLDKILF